MTVADPLEIGCRYCGVAPGEPCRDAKARKRLRDPHALRKADARLDEALPGWQPDPDEGDAVVLDFVSALKLRRARGNGFIG